MRNSINFQICQKSSALDYLQRYWTKALLVVNRLQMELQTGFRKDVHSSDQLYYKQVKTFLNCYQLLIVQFHEYCQILEISDLGKCILKIFIQVISIVESTIKNFQNRLKRNKPHGSTGLPEKQPIWSETNLKNATVGKMTENFTYASKQRGRFQIKSMENELLALEQKYEQDIHFLQNSMVKKTRQMAITIEPSNAEFIIKEAFMEMEAKKNSFVNLLEFRSQRLQTDNLKNFKKGFQLTFSQLENTKKQKIKNVSDQLLKIVEKYLKTLELNKKEKLVDIQIQTDKDLALVESQKLATEKLNKLEQLKNIQIKQLKQEIKQISLKNQLTLSNFRKNEETYEKQLTRQKMKMIKLEQRASIASKFCRSQLEIDQIISKKNIQNSQNNIQIFSTPSKNNEGETIQKKRTLSKRSNMSRARPSYDNIKISCQPKRSQFFQFNQQKEFKMVTQADVQSSKNQRKIENIIITYANAESQTQMKEVKQKEIKQKPKFVKFKKNFKIRQQYSCYIAHFSQSQAKYTNQNDITFNQQNSTLFRKKKQKNIKTLNKINEEDQDQSSFSKRTYQQSFQKLSIGNSLENCFNFIRKKDDQNSVFQQKFEPKVKIVNQAFNFTKEDIENLFLNVQKGLNYQYLNYTIKPYRNTHQVGILKSKKSYSKSQILQNNNHKTRAFSCHFMNEHIKKQNDELITPFLLRHFKLIKSTCLVNYEKLRNFIRFPYSTVYKSEQNKWKQLSKNQKEIDIHEVRRILGRLAKIHLNCEKKIGLGICKHQQSFLKKIGLSFTLNQTNISHPQIHKQNQMCVKP